MSSTTTQRPPPTNRSIPPSTRLVRAKASISSMAAIDKKPSSANSTPSSAPTRTPSTRSSQYGRSVAPSSSSATERSLMPPPPLPTSRSSTAALRKPSPTSTATTTQSSRSSPKATTQSAATAATRRPLATQSTAPSSSLSRSASTTQSRTSTAQSTAKPLGRSASVRTQNTRSTVGSVREELESRSSTSSGEALPTRTPSVRTRPSSLIGPSKTTTTTTTSSSSSSAFTKPSTTTPSTATSTVPSQTALRRAPPRAAAQGHRRAISTSSTVEAAAAPSAPASTLAAKRAPFTTLRNEPTGPKEPTRPITSYTTTTLPSQTIDPLTQRHQLNLLRLLLLHSTADASLTSYEQSARQKAKEHYEHTKQRHAELQKRKGVAAPLPFPKSVEREEEIQILSESATSVLTLSVTELPPLRHYFDQWISHSTSSNLEEPDPQWTATCSSTLRKLQINLGQLRRVGNEVDGTVLGELRALAEGMVEEVEGWGKCVRGVVGRERRRVERGIEGLEMTEIMVEQDWVPAWRR